MHGLDGMKIAVVRPLVCMGEATKPMSEDELFSAVEIKYHKRHTDIQRQCVIRELLTKGWITTELSLTDAGRWVFQVLKDNQASWASKFFRVSNSPNVDTHSSVGTPPMHRQEPLPAFQTLDSRTWAPD